MQAHEAPVIDEPRKAALDRYRKLVFSPLALPSPPAVDPARLVEWMTWARVEGLERGRNAPERGYESATGQTYPWLMANIFYAERGPIEDSFEAAFPEIVDYARLFPFNGLRYIVLIAQRASRIHLHTDSDGTWGFRFYLNRRREDALYFCLAHDHADPLPRSTRDWSRYVNLSERQYASWPEEERPYLLNSVLAAHCVEAADCRLGERIACLVLPEGGLDEGRLLALLDESRERFGEHQIWHDSPNARSAAPLASH